MRPLSLLLLGGFLVHGAELSLRDLRGEIQSLEQYRGRVVILNYWATWCVPCREEMPVLSRIHARYRERSVAVIGASVDDLSTQSQVKPFVEQLQIQFPIWTAATTEHMQRFELGTALPATAILDGEGNVAFRILGPLTAKELTARVDFLLSGKGKAPERLIDKLSTHEEEEDHAHAPPSVEGASMVPS